MRRLLAVLALLSAGASAGLLPAGSLHASPTQGTPKRASFSVTMTARISGSISYRRTGVRERCRYSETGGGGATVSLRSGRPSRAIAVFRRDERGPHLLYLSGVLRSLVGTLTYTFVDTETALLECEDGRPPTRTVMHCDPAQPARFWNVRAHFFDAAGSPRSIAFAAMRHRLTDVELRGCTTDPSDVQERLGGIQLARGRLDEAKLLNDKGKRVVVEGLYRRSSPFPATGAEGSVSREIRWRLTFKRLILTRERR